MASNQSEGTAGTGAVTRKATLWGFLVLFMALGVIGLANEKEDPACFGINGPESPYLSGRVPFRLEVCQEQAGLVGSVNWYLDGRQVRRCTEAPYEVTIDLGPDILPHRISAAVVSRDRTDLWSGEWNTLGLTVAYNDRVSLVVVPVTVLHPEGYFQTGLGRNRFRVFEDGVSQELTCFSSDLVPLRVALVIDSSDSMRGRIREIRKAARTLIERLSTADRATVMSFDDDLVRHCGFSGDKELLFDALKGIGPGGGTALFDAVYGASRAFRENEGKRVMILFTDGQDEKYRRPAEKRRRMERAVSAAAKENITVYTIGLGRDVDQDMLTTVADTTGGVFFPLGQIRDLAGAYGRIFDELGSQYTLCYRPAADGAVGQEQTSWRSIRVEVDDQTLLVRHKKGYVPSR
jgi:Ca-activated chloride channel family protein